MRKGAENFLSQSITVAGHATRETVRQRPETVSSRHGWPLAGISSYSVAGNPSPTRYFEHETRSDFINKSKSASLQLRFANSSNVSVIKVKEESNEKRFESFPAEQTSQSVGPGSYNIPSDFLAKKDKNQFARVNNYEVLRGSQASNLLSQAIRGVRK